MSWHCRRRPLLEPVETLVERVEASRPRYRAVRAGPVVALAMISAACATGQPAAQQPYTLRPSDAAVQVDTPQLRTLKAAAGIESCPVSQPDAAPKPAGLPPLTLPCLGGGREVDLAGLRGTPVVLNFWAQTCGPCRKESPILQEVHEAAGDRVEVIGVDWLDPRPSWAIAFANELGLTYPQLADPEGATRAPLRITTLPRTLFVDADGSVVYTEFAALTSADQLRSLIKHHLGVSLPPLGGN